MHAGRPSIFKVVLLTSLLIVATLVGSCMSSSGRSQRQVAYDACLDTWNDKMRFENTHKAIVSGVSGGRSSCFSVWSRSDSYSAINDAMSNCHKKYDNCFVFASDSGLNNWSRQMSDNGGTDGSREQSGAATSALLQGLITGMGSTYRSNGYSSSRSVSVPQTPSYSGGNGSGPCKSGRFYNSHWKSWTCADAAQ